jgi:glucose-6-phosphate 1-dehydrogenase
MLYHLRFANAFVDPMLNHQHVESISVVMKEMFGAEGRGGRRCTLSMYLNGR